eukprot:2329756-Rhodomonas_salina.1
MPTDKVTGEQKGHAWVEFGGGAEIAKAAVEKAVRVGMGLEGEEGRESGKEGEKEGERERGKS